MIVNYAIPQIFFPRSIAGEIAARDAARERKRMRSLAKTQNEAQGNGSSVTHPDPHATRNGNPYPLAPPRVEHSAKLPSYYDRKYSSDAESVMMPLSPTSKTWINDEETDTTVTVSSPKLPIMRPNRRRGGDVELGGIDGLTENNLSRHNLRPSNINPVVHNFTSPISAFRFNTLSRARTYLRECYQTLCMRMFKTWSHLSTGRR